MTLGSNLRTLSGCGVEIRARRDVRQAATASISTNGGYIVKCAGRDITIGRLLAGPWSASTSTAGTGRTVSLDAGSAVGLVSGLDTSRTPAIAAGYLGLSEGNVAAMDIAADTLQARAGAGDLVFTDHDGWKAPSGLTLGWMQAQAGSISVRSSGTLRGEAYHTVGDEKDLTLQSEGSAPVALTGAVGGDIAGDLQADAGKGLAIATGQLQATAGGRAWVDYVSATALLAAGITAGSAGHEHRPPELACRSPL